MNIGKAIEPSVAIGLDLKNRVMGACQQYECRC